MKKILQVLLTVTSFCGLIITLYLSRNFMPLLSALKIQSTYFNDSFDDLPKPLIVNFSDSFMIQKQSPGCLQKFDPYIGYYSRFGTNNYYGSVFKNKPRCDKIISNDNHNIKHVTDKLKNSGKRSTISDQRLADFSSNCSNFTPYFPVLPFSKAELEYPIAYILTAHRDAEQVLRLLQAIYAPQNIYCIHADSKSSLAFHNVLRNFAKCFDNVFLTKSISVVYASYSRLEADLLCMNDLLHSKKPWKYVINLCGQDFPLKTNREIVTYLKSLHGKNDVETYLAPHLKWRWQKVYKTINDQLINTAKDKESLTGIELFKGSAYYALTYEFCRFVFTNPDAIRLRNWLKTTYSPDENFWATLQRHRDAPGRYDNTQRNKRYNMKIKLARWGGESCKGFFLRGVCVFGTGDLPSLVKEEYMFANKFILTYDHITVDCLTSYRYSKMVMDYGNYSFCAT
ncbi:Beta-1,3-galactosyl-O-glycosyl-glycoprotein beta-1,6-N-acetylglucosaminyltransferase 3 [Trichoplax sp. H2]|nr:Beta-1,3-galactosyl-O-glycosyl-glycoprotein beta-1,6-N-acetylglucosaminyltransferase 3 [Trichoplax sp. H2]|eukprot:RDD42225.1 Beta-1,3-galactosyl-O-glycosyl-glycoprotein beta-1,6-N-acetylglucosaminyltransferase 3 [Trichoplax sp. H2]